MKRTLDLIPFSALLLAVTLNAYQARIVSVDPATAKAGDVIVATGEGIGESSIDAVYLTNGTDDLRVQIVEQSDQSLKFKVPSRIKPGRWALMLRTKGAKVTLLELPVKVTVE